MDGHIMRCGTIGSCQSAATSEIVKRCSLLVMSLTHVSGTIASVQTFTFTNGIPIVPNAMHIASMYLVTGDTWRQEIQLHHVKNQRHQTEYVGVRQQLHERPLVILTDAVVYPEHKTCPCVKVQHFLEHSAIVAVFHSS